MLRIIGSKTKNSLVSKFMDTTGVYSLSDIARYRSTKENRVRMQSLVDLQQQYSRNVEQSTEVDIWPHNWYNMLYVFESRPSTQEVRAEAGTQAIIAGQIYGTTKSPSMGENENVTIPGTTARINFFKESYLNETKYPKLSLSRKRFGTVDGVTHIIVPQVRPGGTALYPTVVKLTNNTKTSVLSVPEIEALTGWLIYEYSSDGTKLVISNGTTFAYFTRSGDTYTKLNAPTAGFSVPLDFSGTFDNGSPLKFNHDGSYLFTAGEVATTAGSASFTGPGTYSWTAPAGTTSVNAVCVGGGGGGYNSSAVGGGGGGASLATGTVQVTPGQTYTVIVGRGGAANQGGTRSEFLSIWGFPGYSGNSGSGGQGGQAATGGSGGYGGRAGAGGGAGGYSGSGGSGAGSDTSGGQAGTGGGAGGGGGAGSTIGARPTAGGGVNIFGEGVSGAGAAPGSVAGGQGGSGGGNGGSRNGGLYGGGGARGGSGGSGAVRLTWLTPLSPVYFPEAYDMTGTTPTKITLTADTKLPEKPKQAEFTPDGKHVMFVCRNAGIYVYKISGTTLTLASTITHPNYVINANGVLDSAWSNVYCGLTISPDGNYFSYSVFSNYIRDTTNQYLTYYPQYGRFVVSKLDADTGAVTMLSEDVGTNSVTFGNSVFTNNNKTIYNLGRTGQITEYSITDDVVNVVTRVATPYRPLTEYALNYQNEANRRDLYMF